MMWSDGLLIHFNANLYLKVTMIENFYAALNKSVALKSEACVCVSAFMRSVLKVAV